LRLGARDSKSGDIKLKVVNGPDEPVRTRIDLQGAGTLSGSGQAAVLTSASPVDEKHLGRTEKGFANDWDGTFLSHYLNVLVPGKFIHGTSVCDFR
jgi:hypothetical protein